MGRGKKGRRDPSAKVTCRRQESPKCEETSTGAGTYPSYTVQASAQPRFLWTRRPHRLYPTNTLFDTKISSHRVCLSVCRHGEQRDRSRPGWPWPLASSGTIEKEGKNQHDTEGEEAQGQRSTRARPYQNRQDKPGQHVRVMVLFGARNRATWIREGQANPWGTPPVSKQCMSMAPSDRPSV
ncbi:hypothetical protein LZ30DRAFT_697554 [Colletotrichum cereale]|nr:hypothetical protein LZ30DRAFT_697554 [Colletotrichum cereale]